MLPGLLKATGIYEIYEKWLSDQIASDEIPEHVAVIFDGGEEGPAKYLLIYGTRSWRDFLKWCLDLNIKTVTLYVFSTANLMLPQDELKIIYNIIQNEMKELTDDRLIHEFGVHVEPIGRLELLPESLKVVLSCLKETTASYHRHYLNLAVAYDGRAEIVDAAKRMIEDVRNGILDWQNVEEDALQRYLYTSHLENPYPNLIIRTSSEKRISGFLLWQAAYSELIFLDVYWPRLRRIDFLRAIRTYQRRVRRFGA
jgi:tritrans,polycis-undecaprenyl-diphosphate synthase [geranylgeranyl-diphosphate specific]